MKFIRCQECVARDPKEGCATCGGYTFLLEKIQCGGCGTFYWERPRNQTIYVGKRWKSFDGLEFVAAEGFKRFCAYCPEFREMKAGKGGEEV